MLEPRWVQRVFSDGGHFDDPLFPLIRGRGRGVPDVFRGSRVFESDGGWTGGGDLARGDLFESEAGTFGRGEDGGFRGAFEGFVLEFVTLCQGHQVWRAIASANIIKANESAPTPPPKEPKPSHHLRPTSGATMNRLTLFPTVLRDRIVPHVSLTVHLES